MEYKGLKHNNIFPSFQFRCPREMKDLNDKRKEEITSKEKFGDKEVMLAWIDGKCSIYIEAIYFQKIKEVNEYWSSKIWVGLTTNDLQDYLEDKEFKGALASMLLWYQEYPQFYPLKLKYSEEYKLPIVVEVSDITEIIYKDFNNGLDLDIAITVVTHLKKSDDYDRIMEKRKRVFSF